MSKWTMGTFFYLPVTGRSLKAPFSYLAVTGRSLKAPFF